LDVAAEREIEDHIEMKLQLEARARSAVQQKTKPTATVDSVLHWNDKFQLCIENIRKLSPNTHMEERINGIMPSLDAS
jgi:hypothetical protein